MTSRRLRPIIWKQRSAYGASYKRISDEQDRYMATLAEILNRRRRKVPFPLPLEDVYLDLFPTYFLDLWHSNNKPKRETDRELGIRMRRENLKEAMAKTELVRVELSNTRPQQAFYMRFPFEAIGTSSEGKYFQLPHNHKNFLPIRNWIEKAQQFDNRTDDIVNKLGEFFRACQSDAVARKVWPFIMDAVKAVGPCHPVGPTVVAHVDHVVSRTQRGYIETAVAEGMMLDPYVPDAWIGYGPCG